MGLCTGGNDRPVVCRDQALIGKQDLGGLLYSRTGRRVFHPCGSRALWWVQNAALGSTADDLERRY